MIARLFIVSLNKKRKGPTWNVDLACCYRAWQYRLENEPQRRDSTVLLTNSMRRKLTTNLTLVVLMLVLFSISSIVGINSYRRMVSDLELSITNIPRRDALIASLTGLLKPFKIDFPSSNDPIEERRKAAGLQYRKFEESFLEMNQRVEQFQIRWQELPDNLRPGHGEESSYLSMFRTIEDHLESLDNNRDLLKNLDLRKDFITDVMQTVAELTEIAERLPDPSNRLGERLKEAREDYQLHLRLVASTGVISFLLFSLLMHFSKRGLFTPIAELTKGVEKISRGDYSYRLDLKTDCEISQMAMTFNNMAAKIEQDQQDKEQEIQQRCKQLVLSERLAGVGFLASGVAHEINNPLSVIMNAVNGVKRRLPDELLQQLSEKDRKRVQDYLELVLSESERCEIITKKLLDFSYSGEEERNLYDVTAICQDVTSMVSHLSKYRSKTVSLNRTDPLHAWVSGPEIKQVVLNLVAKALDASDEGGEVQVMVTELPDQVEISVIDHGCGMTKKQKAKIFEPFFTTKEVGKGTGLGLSITHRIVVDHNGRLEVLSDGPGTGSTFTLRLPKKLPAQRAA